MKAFNNIYSINTKNFFILLYRDFVSTKISLDFLNKEEPHPPTMLRIGRVPGNLGASHYDGFAFPIKKALTKVKAFNKLYILLYRDFVDKRRTSPVNRREPLRYDEICVSHQKSSKLMELNENLILKKFLKTQKFIYFAIPQF